MRRAVSALIGTVLVATSVALSPLHAAHADQPFPTEFRQVFISELSPVVAGQYAGFDATLVSGDAPVSGATVSLLVRPYGAKSYTVGATTTTDAEGDAVVRLRLNRSTTYRWHFAGSGFGADGFGATTSAPSTQGIASKVRIAGNDLTLKRGQRLVITGTTFPVQPGKKVLLMRGQIKYPLTQTPEPKVIGRGVVRPDGSIRLTTKFAQSGKKQLFVTVAGGKGNTEGSSNYVRVRVR